MLVYCTEEFKNRLKQLNLVDKFAEIEGAIRQAEAVPRLVDAGLEPYHGIWIKKLGGVGTVSQLRMLSCVINVKHHSALVLCFFALLKRSDQEYDKIRKMLEQGRYSPPVSEEEVDSWLNSLPHLEETDTGRLPPLESSYRVWFHPLGGLAKSADDAVYESIEWCKRSRDNETQTFWQDYYKLVGDVIDDDTAGEEIEIDGATLRYHRRNRRGILFQRYDLEGRSQILLLLQTAAHHNHVDEARRLLTTLQIDKISSCDDIARVAGRAYPYYILADDQLWHDIQNDQTANLALSAEEENLLSDALALPHQLPLFINGRAGSGKSTMLYYLFARYIERALRLHCPEKLIFLTYSEPLLHIAKQSVTNVLMSQLSRQSVKSSDNKLDEVIEQCFWPFQKFLLQLVQKQADEAKRTSQDLLFPSHKYVDFREFKQILCRCHLPEARQFSPETVWHVIRTYIKGYKVDDFLSPDEYEDIPRDERTVDKETYAVIYDRIWHWYQNLLDSDGLWDDQDLVRYVLSLNINDMPWFIAIFCDEVQDFSRVEFQLLFKLSIASRFNLPPEATNLPFAFAGDPLQTISPTGFRWEALKAAFYNNVVAPLGVLGDHYSLKERELEYNYRSTPEVTRFANLVQLWRSAIFNRLSVKPQKPWQAVRGAVPGLYIIERDVSAAQFAESAQKKEYTIIVPCELGGEEDFVRQDDVLGRLEGIANIWSPSAAKGLEFRQVIIYKFGDHCTVDFENKERNDIREEYFFNKLYVAVTRARERLFIVDTIEGYEKLWKYFTEQAYGNLLQNEQIRRRWNEHDVQTFAQDIPVEVIQADKPLEIAEQLQVKGEQSDDALLLLRASEYYTLAGDSFHASLCKARAQHLLRDYDSAGKLYTEIGKHQEAFESYWQGRLWREAYNLQCQFSVGNDVQRDVVNSMVTQGEVDFVERAVSLIDKSLYRLSQYPEHLGDLAARYVKATEYLLSHANYSAEEPWEKRGDCAIRMADMATIDFETRKGLRTVAFLCFYRTQRWTSAVDAAERAGIRDGREYFEAKAYAEGMPAGLQWLARLRDGDERILSEWQKAGKPMNREWARYLTRPLENARKFVELTQAYEELAEPYRILDVLNNAILSGKVTEDELIGSIRALQELPVWHSKVDLISAAEGRYAQIAEKLIDLLSNAVIASPSDKDVDENKRRLRLSYVRLIKNMLSRKPADTQALSRLFKASLALGARDETSRSAYMLLRQYDVSSQEFSKIVSDINAARLLGHTIQVMADDIADSAEAAAKLLHYVLTYPEAEQTKSLRVVTSAIETMIQGLIDSTQWKVYISANNLFSAYIILQENHIDALRYLESFTEHQDTELRDSARSCWLQMKRKQITYHESRSENAAAERTRRELVRRMKDWGMLVETTEPTKLEAARFLWLVDGDVTFEEDDEAFYTSLGQVGLRLLKRRKKMILVNAVSFAYYTIDMIGATQAATSPIWEIVHIESEKRGRYTIKVGDRVVTVTTRQKQVQTKYT